MLPDQDLSEIAASFVPQTYEYLITELKNWAIGYGFSDQGFTVIMQDFEFYKLK